MKAKNKGARCDECPLREAEYVPPEPHETDIAAVGNFPTDHAVREGRPFVGPAAMELHRSLANCGVRREMVHWTTAVLCKPPENDMKRFKAVLQKRNRAINKENTQRKKDGKAVIPVIPSPEECYAPRLQAELRSFPHILAFGTAAAKATIHRSASIMGLRGAPTEVERDGRTIRIMPCLHPAQVMREKRWTHVFRSDLKKAIKWFSSGLDWIPPQVVYNPSPRDLKAFLTREDITYYTYDVETDGIECLTARIRCIAIGVPKFVHVIGILSINGQGRFYPPDEEIQIKEVLKEFFLDRGALKAGHNAGYYDRIIVEKWLGVTPEPLIDTMLVHRLVESELPHSLGFVGSLYTNAPSWKTDREGRKKAYGSETDHELHEYCAYDVAITAEVLPELLDKVKSRQQQKLIRCDHKLQEVCADMHTIGMRVDQVKRKLVEKELMKEISDRRIKIRDITGNGNLNPASTVQLRDLFFDRWDLIAPLDEKDRTTDAGDPSTSDVVLRSLLTLAELTKAQRAVISEVRLYRRAMKVLGTYVTKLRYSTEEAWGGWDDGDNWLEKDWRDRYGLKKLGIVDPVTDRMYPGYNAHVTNTGRLSSSQPINAQNFPKYLRSLVVPSPGNVFVGADMDQLELRIAAIRWESVQYLEAFWEGIDPHSMVTAQAIFGSKFMNAEGWPSKKNNFEWSGTAYKLRQLAKIVQYASQYAASPETVHKVITQTEISNPDGTTSLPYLHLSVREARVMHKKWCEGSQFDEGWKREIDTWRDRGYLEEPVMGRRRDFLDGENINELVNFPIQASGASLMNIALIGLYQDIPLCKWGPNTGIVNQCHDSIVVECPAGEAENVSRLIEHHMNLEVPCYKGMKFTASAGVGMTWKEVG